jgi:hypothetical protein
MMPRVFQSLLFLAVTPALIAQETARHTPQIKLPTPQPRWTVSLAKHGWTPQESESNRVFFRDMSIGKLMALDLGIKLVFVSSDVLVAYSTVKTGQNWRTASRRLQAYFIRVSDGSLIKVQQWTSTIRKDPSIADTESRIIPLTDGRFLVQANGTVMLYGSGLSLIRELKLNPFGPTEMWGIQRIADGSEIFLRHETSICPGRDYCIPEYEWRDAEAFQLLGKAVGNDSDGRDVRGAEDGAFIKWTSPGYSIFRPNQPPRKICSDPLCNRIGIDDGGSSKYFLVSSEWDGIGVVDRQRGLLWFAPPSPTNDPHNLSFGFIDTALSGRRFAFWVNAFKKGLFDSVLVRHMALFVFDIDNPKHVFAMAEPSRGAVYALSPDGKQIAAFDDKGLHLYDVP